MFDATVAVQAEQLERLKEQTNDYYKNLIKIFEDEQPRVQKYLAWLGFALAWFLRVFGAPPLFVSPYGSVRLVCFVVWY